MKNYNCKHYNREMYARGYCHQCYDRERNSGRLHVNHHRRAVVGETHGSLTVIELKPYSSDTRNRLVVCKCECGHEKCTITWIGPINRLRSGNTLSCGAYKKAESHKRATQASIRAATKRGSPICDCPEKVGGNRLCQRHQSFWSIYRVSPAEYDAMLEVQQNKCAICCADLSNLPREKVHIDHDHLVTNKKASVRGIVCSQCNHMLGKARDSADILRAAANYIDSYRKAHDEYER